MNAVNYHMQIVTCNPRPFHFFSVGASQVTVVDFTGSRGTPANASGLYRCVVFSLSLETQTFVRQTEQSITINVQGEMYGHLYLNGLGLSHNKLGTFSTRAGWVVRRGVFLLLLFLFAVPSGVGLSAILQFSVAEFQRLAAQELVTQEEQLERFAGQVSLLKKIRILVTILGECRTLWGRAGARVWDGLQMYFRERILQCTLLRPDLAVLPLAVAYASVRSPDAPPWPDLAVLPLAPAYASVYSPVDLPTPGALPSALPTHLLASAFAVCGPFTAFFSASTAWLAAQKYYICSACQGYE